MTLNLKVIVCGPKGVGKSTISNGICDYQIPVPSDYRPTKSIRILETEQEVTDENKKNNNFLATNSYNKTNIQLWDMGGDKALERIWPAIKHEAHGAILIIDGKNSKYENLIDEWINEFCLPEIPIEKILCIAYNKENQKSDNQKTSNQFPKLKIFETNYDLNNILPIFHRFIDDILNNIKK